MRRKEKEITDRKEIDHVLNTAVTGHLGMVDGGKPYVVPVFFGYDGSAVYIHCATQGKKIDVLAKNPEAFFTAFTGGEVISAELACSFGSAYRSVMIEGAVEIVTDEAGKSRGLDVIMRKYSEEGDDEFFYAPGQLSRTAILKLTVRSITGKRSG
jgi:nitroimidazol reductase NimA-like FMN-containing flavoprotein (pyridoxamine 5'-phosphate oxidase superfamily)